MAGELLSLRCPHDDHTAWVGRVRPVHERDEGSISRQQLRVGELEEPHAPHRGQKAVREDGDRDGCLRRIGAAGGEELCFHPHPSGSAPHHDGVAAGRAAVSHGAIFQLREGERMVPHPRHDLGAADEGNG